MRHWLAVVVLLLIAAGCGADSSDGDSNVPELLPIEPSTVRVNETLRLELTVSNPDGIPLNWSIIAPDVPGIDRVAQIAGTPNGGEFVLTPLASHVGVHDFEMVVGSSRGESRQVARITVEAGASSAPIFLAPGAGGTFDLTTDPCVRFDIEVRDDDSADVVIDSPAALPVGAVLTSTGAKTGAFEWCPTPDQVDTSLRWELGLRADDGAHPPTIHRYVVVLRAPAKEGCPGTAPDVQITAPAKDATVASDAGYPVTVSITDDHGVRDAPILYWTTTAPPDIENPDLGSFTQVECRPQGSGWVGSVPPLDLAAGEERVVFVVVSAIDNDDAAGTACDHRTDTEVLSFVATAGSGGGGAGAVLICGSCTASSQCASGLCAATEYGGVCLEACVGAGSCSAGSCDPFTAVDGVATTGCGSVDFVCLGGGADECIDDEFEENDTPAEALSLFAEDVLEGVICPGDDDYYFIDVAAGTQVLALLDQFRHADGDLDLQLLGAGDTVIATSAGETDEEFIQWCAPVDESLTVRVAGYNNASNHYRLSFAAETASCCIDDRFEPDDTLATARTVRAGDSIEGMICPDDDDYLEFSVPSPSIVEILLVFDSTSVDLDLFLYDESGRVVAQSETIGDESIEYLAEASGTYTMRISGFLRDSGEYLADVTVDPI